MTIPDAIDTPAVRSCAVGPMTLALIGPIRRVQVQRSSLKLGERPRRWFEPGPIMRAMALRIDRDGVTGIGTNGELIVDVHNRAHPESKFRGENGVSVGFTSHYSAMRERFGERLTDGIAGENILVESADMLGERDLAGGIVIATADGSEVALDEVIVAAPCVEFAKYASGYAPDVPADRAITDAVDFLHRGLRGFYATIAASTPQPAIIRPGDLVYRRLPS